MASVVEQETLVGSDIQRWSSGFRAFGCDPEIRKLCKFMFHKMHVATRRKQVKVHVMQGEPSGQGIATHVFLYLYY